AVDHARHTRKSPAGAGQVKEPKARHRAAGIWSNQRMPDWVPRNEKERGQGDHRVVYAGSAYSAAAAVRARVERAAIVAIMLTGSPLNTQSSDCPCNSKKSNVATHSSSLSGNPAAQSRTYWRILTAASSSAAVHLAP